MMFFAIFGGRGLLQIYHLREERDRILISNARLREENQKLSQQVQRLRYHKEEVEKIAREELGLVKKGRLFTNLSVERYPPWFTSPQALSPPFPSLESPCAAITETCGKERRAAFFRGPPGARVSKIFRLF